MNCFTCKEMEKFLYNIIYLNMMGLSVEGFFGFIEENNLYIDQTEEIEWLSNQYYFKLIIINIKKILIIKLYYEY